VLAESSGYLRYVVANSLVEMPNLDKDQINQMKNYHSPVELDNLVAKKDIRSKIDTRLDSSVEFDQNRLNQDMEGWLTLGMMDKMAYLDLAGTVILKNLISFD
jgi:hypothetical protein